ncbi:prepilin-type N-terminal cleavage/methylation domain-containing protein [Sulfurimonas aquatica]|uniref:prepilin-type N-terminal cleavage/methylation domain-containing protein n=1 Tax=Sulfurimonas aquatica TaxID=2672570 RepID=UPI001A9A1B74|nr:prepilin-type N-terminal cleavage/methylation domain-containing protein [Sulfurimonas aquatica]
MKKAFSLIELMIVIVIIGVVYTLAITKLKSVSEQKMSPSLSNLKEYLLSYVKDDVSKVRLLCLDDCSECRVYVDDKKVESLKSFFDESIEVYYYDALQGATEVKPRVFFNEEDVQESVCFSFDVGKNLVADQLIVVYEEKAYDYSSYFQKTIVYDSIEELVSAKREFTSEIMQ